MGQLIPLPIDDDGTPRCSGCGRPLTKPEFRTPRLDCRVPLDSGIVVYACGRSCTQRLMAADAERSAA